MDGQFLICIRSAVFILQIQLYRGYLAQFERIERIHLQLGGVQLARNQVRLRDGAYICFPINAAAAGYFRGNAGRFVNRGLAACIRIDRFGLPIPVDVFQHGHIILGCCRIQPEQVQLVRQRFYVDRKYIVQHLRRGLMRCGDRGLAVL